VTPLIRDHDLALSIESPDHQTGVTANIFVEVEDLAEVTRCVRQGHDVHGEMFHWSKQSDSHQRLTLIASLTD
jgi:hypothetical protein